MKLQRIALAFLGLSSICAWSRKTNFSEDHKGFTFGVGTYPLSGPEGWDTLPSMVPKGVTVSGQNSVYILPLRLGFFGDYGALSFDIFYKYITNSGATWGTTGNFVGSGKSRIHSNGFGASVIANFFQASQLRIGFIGQYEFINQRINHEFVIQGQDTQKIALANTSSTFGGGLHFGYWLGDLWSLNLNTIYNYGTPSTWKVARSDQFLGNGWEKGALKDPKTGDEVKASYSGIFVELAVRLSFYTR